jgi:hypothetical protein
MTADLLTRYNIPFKLFVEDTEYDLYAKKYGEGSVVNLGGHDFGGVAFARTFIKKFSTAKGELRHWQMDDDIQNIYFFNGNKVIKTDPDIAFRQCEQFCDKYRNIAIAGLSANTFVKFSHRPYEINKFAYTCVLINNRSPYFWNEDIEDDLDFNLQVLTGGWCTIKFNIYAFAWSTTGSREGGYTDLYADGKRLIRMKETLKRWPILPAIVPKGKGGYRIQTERVWKRFTTVLQNA